jgi:Family of unknown function (DUF6529)
VASGVPAAAPSPAAPAKRSARWVVVPLLVFAFVSLVAGFVAKAQEPEAGGWFELFFSDTIHMKVWLATGAATLGLVQVSTAAWIFRKLPWPKPAWVNPLHRWSGRLAFVLTLPIAYHCIFKLGFQSGSDRVLFHSLLGSAFYGAFAAKVTIVRLRRFPTPVLPIAGATLFTVLIAVWYTSALWFFREVDTGF